MVLWFRLEKEFRRKLMTRRCFIMSKICFCFYFSFQISKFSGILSTIPLKWTISICWSWNLITNIEFFAYRIFCFENFLFWKFEKFKNFLLIEFFVLKIFCFWIFFGIFLDFFEIFHLIKLWKIWMDFGYLEIEFGLFFST